MTLSAFSDLRGVARDLFDAGVRAADPYGNVRLALEDRRDSLEGRRISLIAAGKAAGRMMEAALDATREMEIGSRLCVTSYENHRRIQGVECVAAGHPVPDQNGLLATRRIGGILQRASADDVIILLLSGGASSLLPAPAEGVSLEDKILVSQLLLKSGCDIRSANLVRQNLSFLKGGGFCALAHPAPVFCFALSDVVGDDVSVIASGLTAPPIGGPSDAARELGRLGLWDKIPASARAALSPPFPPAPESCQAVNTIVGSLSMSLAAICEAAAERSPSIITSRLEGDVTEAASFIAKHALENGDRPGMLLFGGETTVRVRGAGLGGRNQELALRVARELTGRLPGGWIFMSAGTDGRDGPTDAAGGIVDGGTVSRLKEAGVDLDSSLESNDSYNALRRSGDLLVTGGTGTNVGDIQLLLFP